MRISLSKLIHIICQQSFYFVADLHGRIKRINAQTPKPETRSNPQLPKQAEYPYYLYFRIAMIYFSHPGMST